MTELNYKIRTMNRQEIDLAIDWAALEGWNPGLHDSECFFSADNNGFLVGLLNDEPIATISVVKYGTTFGFLGFYIVKPEYRGQGYGLQIWNEGMKYLEGRNVGLDGVIAQQDNYRKSGFKLAFRNIRFEGKGADKISATPAIVNLQTLPFDLIYQYDKAFFPDCRKNFLKCWLSQPQRKGYGIIQNSKLAGYGVIRKCREGYKIGPLFANSCELAEQLFLALRNEVAVDENFYFDTPEINLAATDLAGRYNMQMVFETARMYTGETPEISVDRLFGVTSFELG